MTIMPPESRVQVLQLWPINFVLTYLKFMAQESLSTLQSINFHSQCAHAPLNRAIEMKIGEIFFYRGISIYLYKCSVTLELLTLLRSLEK